MVEKATDEDGGEQATEFDCQALKMKKQNRYNWLGVRNNTDIKTQELLLPLQHIYFDSVIKFSLILKNWYNFQDDAAKCEFKFVRQAWGKREN